MKREMMHLSALLLVFAVLAAGCGSLGGGKASDKAAGPSRAAGEASASKSTKDDAKAQAAPSVGARENPVPWGKPGRVKSEWEIQIQDINPDAWSVIQPVSSSNEPPQEGQQYVLARIKISYVGKDSGAPWSDLDFKYLGNDSLAYQAYSRSCGEIPDPLKDVEEMFPGTTLEANVCFSVPSKAISGGLIIVDPGYWEDEVFFAGIPQS